MNLLLAGGILPILFALHPSRWMEPGAPGPCFGTWDTHAASSLDLCSPTK